MIFYYPLGHRDGEFRTINCTYNYINSFSMHQLQKINLKINTLESQGISWFNMLGFKARFWSRGLPIWGPVRPCCNQDISFNVFPYTSTDPSVNAN